MALRSLDPTRQVQVVGDLLEATLIGSTQFSQHSSFGCSVYTVVEFPEENHRVKNSTQQPPLTQSHHRKPRKQTHNAKEPCVRLLVQPVTSLWLLMRSCL